MKHPQEKIRQWRMFSKPKTFVKLHKQNFNIIESVCNLKKKLEFKKDHSKIFMMMNDATHVLIPQDYHVLRPAMFLLSQSWFMNLLASSVYSLQRDSVINQFQTWNFRFATVAVNLLDDDFDDTKVHKSKHRS